MLSRREEYQLATPIVGEKTISVDTGAELHILVVQHPDRNIAVSGLTVSINDATVHEVNSFLPHAGGEEQQEEVRQC